MGSVEVEYAWDSSRTVSVSIDGKGGDPADWSGQWQFAFVTSDEALADTTTSSNIHITPDLKPEWAALEETEMRRGEALDKVQFSLTNKAGDNVDPTDLAGKLKYKVISTDAEGNQQTVLDTDDKKAISKAVTWDLGDTAVGEGTVELSAEVTTADTNDKDGKKVKGTKLAPVVVTNAISVLPPVSYPTIPGSVDFGEVEGPVDLSATLPSKVKAVLGFRMVELQWQHPPRGSKLRRSLPMKRCQKRLVPTVRSQLICAATIKETAQSTEPLL